MTVPIDTTAVCLALISLAGIALSGWTRIQLRRIDARVAAAERRADAAATRSDPAARPQLRPRGKKKKPPSHPCG